MSYLQAYMNQGNFFVPDLYDSSSLYGCGGMYGCGGDFPTKTFLTYVGFGATVSIFNKLIDKWSAAGAGGAGGAGGGSAAIDENTLQELIEQKAELQDQVETCDGVLSTPENYVDASVKQAADNDFVLACNAYEQARIKKEDAGDLYLTAMDNTNAAQKAYDSIPDDDQHKAAKAEAEQVLAAANAKEDEAKRNANTADKAADDAKKKMDEANTNKTKENEAYQKNIEAVIERARSDKKSLEKDIAKLETQICKGEASLAKSAGYMSKSDFKQMFDANGNLIYSSTADYVAATRKAAANFVTKYKNNKATKQDAKQFLALYNQLDNSQKASIPGIDDIKEKAELISKKDKEAQPAQGGSHTGASS